MPRRRSEGERGVVAPSTAILLAVLIGMVGLVTDVGVWFAQRRDLQATTDAAALAAAPYAGNLSQARSAASAIFTANGVDPASLLTLQAGVYCPDASVAAAQRFQTATCPSGEAPPLDAVRLTASMQTPLILSRLVSSGTSRTIQVTSTAARVNEAGIRAGAGVAALNGGVANAMLSALTGGNISLTALQYQGLLNTNVNALKVLDQLAANVGVTAGTYSQLLASDVSVGALLDATADVLAQQQQVADVSAAIAALRAIEAQIPGTPKINLGKLLDLGLWDSLPIGHADLTNVALNAGLNAYQLATFTLQLANGNNAVALNNVSVLGVLSIDSSIIEPPSEPYFGFGPKGTTVHTAAVRIKAKVAALALLGTLLNTNVPLYIEVGSGDAQITDISCYGAPATDTRVTVAARPAVANLYLAQPPDNLMKNFSGPVSINNMTPITIVDLNIAGLGLLSAAVTTKSQVTVGSSSTTLTFVQPVGTPTMPAVPTTTGIIGRPGTSGAAPSLAVPARATSTNLLSTALGSLADNLSANVRLCLVLVCTDTTLTGSGLGNIFTVLDPLLTGLDGTVDALLRTLGVNAGYVDVLSQAPGAEFLF